MKIALIAAFNEESTIRRVAIETKKYVDKVIVIDDASSDNTFKEASAAGVQVIRNEKNQGFFNSLIIGSENIQKLNPDIIVTLSGNNYHNPRYIPELIEPLETRDIDISLSKKGPYDLRAFNSR